MPVAGQMLVWKIMDTIKEHLEKTFHRHGDVEQLGEMCVHFQVDEDGTARPLDDLPGVAFDTEVQPLIDMIDLEQIRYELGLDFELRWGGPLVVDVSFEYDNRRAGLDWDQWETEVSVELEGCSETKYLKWLQRKSENDVAMPAPEEPEEPDDLESDMMELTVGPM